MDAAYKYLRRSAELDVPAGARRSASLGVGQPPAVCDGLRPTWEHVARAPMLHVLVCARLSTALTSTRHFEQRNTLHTALPRPTLPHAPTVMPTHPPADLRFEVTARRSCQQCCTITLPAPAT